MTGQTYQYVTITDRPVGLPTEEIFAIRDSELPVPGHDEVLIRNEYLSVDPYMRGRMREGTSYHETWPLNEPLSGHAVGTVIESNHPDFAQGDTVTGRLDWAEYSVESGDALLAVDTELIPPSAALGVAGMPGRTAYFGILDICKPQPGETVVVSAAAGAVGSVAGQIARMAGSRVIGIAGSEEKISFITEELGFDTGINYKTTSDLERALGAECPDGVDVYFDNVGGEITDAVIPLITGRARIALCGQIALYNAEDTPVGPRHFLKLSRTQACVRGFSVRNYAHRTEEANARLNKWVNAGELGYRETITSGLENAPKAFIGLFHGDNIGKQLVRIDSESG